MGITAAILGLGVAAGVGTSIAVSKLTGKKKTEAAPESTLLTEAPKLEDAPKKAKGAAEQQRKRALAAGGRGSTLLTGAQGLGQIGSANTQAKTLLGY